MGRVLRSFRLRAPLNPVVYNEEYPDSGDSFPSNDEDYYPTVEESKITTRLRSFSNSKKKLDDDEMDLSPVSKRTRTRKRIVLQERSKSRKTKRKSGRNTKLMKQYKSLLPTILQHTKSFKEYHRTVISKRAKINKTFTIKREKAERRENEKRERLRLQTLINEDEEAYKKLVDHNKDVRLAFLLKQTDEFIRNLTGLVLKHKKEQHFKNNGIEPPKRKRNCIPLESSDDQNLRVDVIKETTGEKLEGPGAPLASQLTGWLSNHPGWTVLPKEDTFDDDEEISAGDGKYEEDDYYTIAHGVREKITEQPSILKNGKLKQYQLHGLEWMVSLYNNNLNGILADEMGLGKTIQTIALLAYLIEKKNNNGPFLIIVPLSVMSNWALEFDHWAPTITYIPYKGIPQVRAELRNKFKKFKFNVLITSYDFVMRDSEFLHKFKWNYMIIDEGHRLKNSNSKMTRLLNTKYKAKHRLLLTGTPLQNNLPELWTLLNFLLPSIFKSCETFEQWFNAPFAKTTEKVELNGEEKMLVIRRLHKVLRPFLLRRLKKEVEAELPNKVEYVIKCDMSGLQKVLYRRMRENGVLLTDGSENDSVHALRNIVMQLRKICCHPFQFKHIEESFAQYSGCDSLLVGGTDLCRASGKLELLDRLLQKLKRAGHRVLIFSQFTTVLTILEDYFAFRQYKYLRLDGLTDTDTRGEMLRQFNKPDSEYFIFILTTRAGGLGLNLQSADTVIIYDSDWNPHQDLQAQDRAHRIGQMNEVRVLRLITVNSVDEQMLNAAKYKLNLDEKVIQAGMFDQKSTVRQRRVFLQSLLANSDANDSNGAFAIPSDKEINRMIARTDDELKLFEQIDNERFIEKESAFIGPKRSQLIDESELPPWLVIDDDAFQKLMQHADSEKVFGRGNRQIKPTDYSGYFKEIDIDDKPNTPVKRELEDDWFESYSSKKAKTEDHDNDKFKIMKNIMASIINYQHDDGKGQTRKLSEAFMWLPKKEDNALFYEQITDPMSIRKITTKIKHRKYADFDALKTDFRTLCLNTQNFYPKDTQIHQDSFLLDEKFIDFFTTAEKERQLQSETNELNNNTILE